MEVFQELRKTSARLECDHCNFREKHSQARAEAFPLALGLLLTSVSPGSYLTPRNLLYLFFFLTLVCVPTEVSVCPVSVTVGDIRGKLLK